MIQGKKDLDDYEKKYGKVRNKKQHENFYLNLMNSDKKYNLNNLINSNTSRQNNIIKRLNKLTNKERHDKYMGYVRASLEGDTSIKALNKLLQVMRL